MPERAKEKRNFEAQCKQKKDTANSNNKITQWSGWRQVEASRQGWDEWEWGVPTPAVWERVTAEPNRRGKLQRKSMPLPDCDSQGSIRERGRSE